MANLMRDNIGLREISSGVKLLVQLSEGYRIEINLTILWAVERTGGR